MTSLRRHLTYANVVATLALVLAVAGGSTAIAISSKHKISGKLIKPGTITTKQLKDGSITGPKLATIDRITVTGDSSGGGRADCPKGSTLVGGGVGSLGAAVTDTGPAIAETWFGSVAAGSAIVTAMCLRANPGK
jgi:hypothetical protein